jgi:hypothetical protein
MRRRALIGALMLIGVGVFLGTTVFREELAHAAQLVSAEIVGPLDAEGNVKVHEQGTANVNVMNRAVPVTVTNTSVGVRQAGEPVLLHVTSQSHQFVFNKRLVIQYVNGPAGILLELLEPGGGLDNDEFIAFPGDPVSELVSITVRPGLPFVVLGAGPVPGAAVLSGYLIEEA